MCKRRGVFPITRFTFLLSCLVLAFALLAAQKAKFETLWDCGFQNSRLWDAKSPENETSRPNTDACEFLRSGQNFLRPHFWETILYLLFWRSWEKQCLFCRLPQKLWKYTPLQVKLMKRIQSRIEAFSTSCNSPSICLEYCLRSTP